MIGRRAWPAAPWNGDRLDCETVLLVEVCLGKPQGHLRRAHRTAADANSFQLFLPGGVMTRSALFMNPSSEPNFVVDLFHFWGRTSLTIWKIGVKSWYSGFARSKYFFRSSKRL
jgi:hypothetical protein